MARQRYSLSHKTCLNSRAKGTYLSMHFDDATADADAIAYAEAVDTICANGIKTQLSKPLKVWDDTSLPGGTLEDIKGLHLVFTDSNHPNERYKLSFPFADKDLSDSDIDTFCGDVVDCAPMFLARDGVTWCTVDGWTKYARSRVRDISQADTTSQELTP